MNIFELMFPPIKFKGKIRLFEAFSGIGTTITVPAVDELTLLREENDKLKARLEALEWEKKYETICKKLDISFRLLHSSTRDFIIERIKENNFFQALKEFYKNEEIDGGVRK